MELPSQPRGRESYWPSEDALMMPALPSHPPESNTVAPRLTVNQPTTARMLDIGPLFAPQSIAVVGASRASRSLGTAIMMNLIHRGYTGFVYRADPKARSIMGIHTRTECTDGFRAQEEPGHDAYVSDAERCGLVREPDRRSTAKSGLMISRGLLLRRSPSAFHSILRQ